MRLYFLHFGLFDPLLGDDRRARSMRGYLIQTDDGENILIDTGMPLEFGQDAEKAFADNGINSFVAPLEMEMEHLVPGQLAKIGLTPEDIDLCVLTHSDLDHMGGFEFIPESVPMLISDVERAQELAGPTNPGLLDIWPEREMTTIEYVDTELRPGLHLLATPGHTPGHFSLLVELENTGPVLLAVDSIKMEGEVPDTGTNVPDAVRSAERVRALAEERGAMLIYGHDGPQWKTLRHAAEFYD